jgi:hypothetical protein
MWAQDFKGGITGGITSSQVDGDRYSGFHKLGFHIGGFVNRPLKGKSSVQFGIQYNQKGSYKNFKDDPTRDFYKIRLHYVEMPVKYQYQYNPKFGFYGGLSFSYLISSLEADGYGALRPEDSPEFNKTDLNALVGLRYQLRKEVHFIASFAYSLYSIRTQYTNSPFLREGRQYNRLLLLGVEYSIL